MPPTKARKGRDQAAKQNKGREFLNLCAVLAEDKEFLALLMRCIDLANPDSGSLNAHVFAKARTSQYEDNYTKYNAFTKFKTLLGTFPLHQLSLPIQNLREACRKHTLETQQSRLKSRLHKKQTAKRIGFQAASSKSVVYLQPLEPIELSKLPTPYPSPKAYVLERNHSKEYPIPNPPKVTDTSCGKCDKLLPIDETELQYTISAIDSAIIRDKDDGKIIAVVIRDFAESYYDLIQPWAVQLVNDSIDRRTLSQRNGPGQLARVGVTDGSRNARVFGWSRSLKKKFNKENRNDHDEHERNISVLFGLFYSLLKAKAPRKIIDDLETVMTSAGLPRLDFDRRMQFPLPFFADNSMTFYGYPLCPPEGYIARNFAKQIHTDKHWDTCPWGAYWNFKRSTPTGESGMEYGANFFIAEYGLRIINSENVCVIWDISPNHGTSWYYDDLEHVGIAFVLSPTTQKVWEDYKKLVEKGEIEDGFSIIEDDLEE